MIGSTAGPLTRKGFSFDDMMAQLANERASLAKPGAHITSTDSAAATRSDDYVASLVVDVGSLTTAGKHRACSSIVCACGTIVNGV